VAESLTGYHPNSGAPIPVAVTAADVVGLWVGLVGATIIASHTRGTGSLARDFGWRIGAWWDLPGGALVGLACQYGLIPLVYLPFESLDRSLRHQLSQPVERDTGATHGVGSLIVLLLVLAVGAPLVEELFFRGLVLRSLMERLPPAPAIIISSLLFALAHFEAVQFAGLALFGVVLAVMAWKTGRLGPSVGAHAAFNAAAVLSSVHLH
jgi:hypothetical protein